MVLAIPARVQAWRSVRSPGFFHNAKRAFFSSFATVFCPPCGPRSTPHAGPRRAPWSPRPRYETDPGTARRSCNEDGDDGRDPLGRIGADQRDLGAALHTEGVEELLQRRAVPARTGPQQHSGIVIN